MARTKVLINGEWVSVAAPTRIGTTPDPPPPPSGTPTAGLFFEQATNLSTYPRKAFSHWFSPYPVRLSNVSASTDAYARTYLKATSTYAPYGGYHRGRPEPQPVSGSGTWAKDDCGLDVAWAQAAGLDGFFLEILGGPPGSSMSSWQNNIAMRDKVAADYPGFLLVPQLDTGGNLATLSADAIADALEEFSSCGWFLADGRLVVATYKHEAKTPAWWDALAASMFTRHGRTVAWLSVYSASTTTSGTYSQWASGRWGSGSDPLVYAARSDYASTCRARGERYLADVWKHFGRPSANWFDESRGLRGLAAAFDDADAKAAEVLVLNTWSDYSEESDFRPGPHHGHVPLDYAAYRIQKWKTGTAPTVLVDAIYTAHRNQMLPNSRKTSALASTWSAAAVTDWNPSPDGTVTLGGPQTIGSYRNPARIRRSTLQNKVEVLVTLTAMSNVEITVNGVTTTHVNVPAGVNFLNADAAPGSVSVAIKRGGSTIASLASPFTIRSDPWVDDSQYLMAGSIRGTTGQFDPTQTNTGATPTYP